MIAESPVFIPARHATLVGDRIVPRRARGLIVFAHGSGSGRYSPRNRAVSERLVAGGFATLLLDLVTPEELREEAGCVEPAIDFVDLAGRVADATRWVTSEERTRNLPVGYFGASTGAAVALIAAATLTDRVGAVVSRGGRPDLVSADVLQRVRAPTLFIVGERDDFVLARNREALAEITPEKRLEIVPHATHLFEEPGALEQVAALALRWFQRHLVREEARGVVPHPPG